MAHNIRLPSLRDLFPEYVGNSRYSSQGSIPASSSLPQNNRALTVQQAVAAVRPLYPPQTAGHACTLPPTGPQAHVQLCNTPTTPHSGEYGAYATNHGQDSHSQRSGSGNVRKFPCTVCDKRFSRPSALDTHMNSHTGDKPYKCPFSGCPKRFSARSNMLRHFRTHECDSHAQEPPSVA